MIHLQGIVSDPHYASPLERLEHARLRQLEQALLAFGTHQVVDGFPARDEGRLPLVP